MTFAVIALGANLGDRHATIMSALRAIGHLEGTRLISVSALRETEPVDAPEGSPNFLNGAALVDTSLSPRELLIALLAIEDEHGRERSITNAPRLLDLDLALHGDAVIDEPDLVVPHPRMLERAFVLDPAADIAPDLVHPRAGQRLSELRDDLSRQTKPMTITTLRTLDDIRTACRGASNLGFVPTMGAIHEGHQSLVRAAREECDTVAASIFVNPLQFGPDEDLDAYPRREAEDAVLLAEAGADLLLLIDKNEMYPPGFATTITQAEDLVTTLEGECRPGHFEGVLTVVAKLFGLVGPCRAFFGRKDYQQTVVVRRMVADLNLPVDVEVCATVREPDGLAMSSRNAYLGDDLRDSALSLVRALRAAEGAFAGGERSATAIEAQMEEILRAGTDEMEYACLVDPMDMSRRPTVRAGDVAVVAARVGPARLIDNHSLGDTIPGLSAAS